ncbi:related to FMP30-mitochondrial inner membrane protein with a role in maintaining mitochondrial morphology [Sporisorium reilianum f. sp. reilianum]|uniref:Related to FMP30-mitochondrial inner membrane protein with a role in maintaining mitochondrial morphology n=1 Tax=Sporisorium reilianum f. sp. reilianum TaxID=72559 RepID=A0A2N8UDH8_9BASI|nr:related to FMP30-mitochondrial inner membrane protein with a role in maintaining mitochondrial morphology [Sporisorium reilianum f. sp. reilianum]
MSAASQPLTAKLKLHVTDDGLPPSHHVLAPAPGTTLSSYLPHWNPQPAAPTLPQNGHPDQGEDDDGVQGIACLPNSIALVESNKVVRTGFRNPWPSWHKPTVAEVWQGLEWGEDHDPAIDYAMLDADLSSGSVSAADGADVAMDPYKDSRPGTPDIEHASPSRAGPSTNDDPRAALPSSWFTPQTASPTTPYTRQQKIKIASKQLLTIQQPAFDFEHGSKLKATWLGHAGVLVQLPPLSGKGEPIRILFDPIFSQRCSPTQIAGPIRSYAAPCAVSSLPPIDVVIISHNHYDHLDYDTICQLWAANRERIRFVVPLGNKDWFVGSHAGGEEGLQPTTTSSSSWTSPAAGGMASAATTSNLSIPPERVTELDWWDEVLLAQPGAGDKVMRVVCTPAQHGSGRYGVDANCALWSSWFVEHPGAQTPTRIFFGGDTGCQFHARSFPPAPPRPVDDPTTASNSTPQSETSTTTDDTTLSPTPTYCGGMRLQPDPDPEDTYPACPAFDEITARLGTPTFLMLPISVGATISFLRSYVPLPDSISPFPRISPGLTAANHMPPWDAVRVFDRMTEGVAEAVCLAVHWGTFISGPEEVLKTLGQLKWACVQAGVRFARDGDESGKGKTFVALNHGASITL